MESKEKIEKAENCLICGDSLADKLEEKKIPGCEHLFCTGCFTTFLETEIKDSKLPVKCPGDRNKCKIMIPPEIIMESLDKDMKNKFMEVSLKKYFNDFGDELSWCPTPDCQYGFELSKICNEFSCPICLKQYCMLCRTEFHEGKSCKEYMSNKGDNQFMELAKTIKMKQCPKCKHWIEKTAGCNHMTCRCKYEFCYVCGRPSLESHTNCNFNFQAEEIGREDEDHQEEEDQRLNNITRVIDNFYAQVERRSNRELVHQPFNNQRRMYRNYDFQEDISRSIVVSHPAHSNYISLGSKFIDSDKEDRPRKKDGTLDKRYAVNKGSNLSLSTSISSKPVGPTKKDGTLDMRYAVNKSLVQSGSSYSDKISTQSSYSGPTKKDGTLDMRYAVNKSLAQSGINSYYNGISNQSSYLGPTKKDGTLDMRYAANKSYNQQSSNLGSSFVSGPTKKDGTLDMRYSVNKSSKSSYNYQSSNSSSYGSSSYNSGPTKKDGTLDMRYACNKRK